MDKKAKNKKQQGAYIILKKAIINALNKDVSTVYVTLETNLLKFSVKMIIVTVFMCHFFCFPIWFLNYHKKKNYKLNVHLKFSHTLSVIK